MSAPATTASTLAAGSVGTVETQYLELPKPVQLDCGRELHSVRVAYETYGALSPRRDNVILVCHALSGDAHAAGFSPAAAAQSTRDGFGADDRDGSAGKGLGWWDGMIGPGKAFDTDRYFVVSTNLLGGCRGTTGPSSVDPATGRPYGSDFPVITVADMVRTERAFLDELGIARLAAAAGGSLGGMQAFEWAIRYPDQIDAVVAIASTHALHPQGMAWNAIAREAIMRDPAWRDGDYYGTGDEPNAGMGVARMIGHITVSLGDRAQRQVRPAAAVRRRHPLHGHRAGVRDRELPAAPGRLVRQAVRRQHLPLHVAGADVLRPRAAVRQRLAQARARGRQRANAADRVQLGLALPAVGIAGDRGGTARVGQAGRAPRDRRALRPRLLPARGGAADADHPPFSGRPVMTAERDLPEADRSFGFETRQLHAGQRPDPNTGARAVPIFQTTSYVFEDPESAGAYFNLQEYGNTYSRIMNPTVAVFEERVANLEGGAGAVAFASGIAAQAAALFTLLEPGDHVVSSSALYGGTVNQFKHLLRKLNVELTWVDPDDPDAWRKAVRANTKAFFGETIGNPAGNVLDIESMASVAHEHELPLIVDNTFATPYLCRPIEWGADIVIHSATKFIGGHGTSIGGVVVEAGTFNWSNGRFPVVADPSPAYHGLQFHETFGTYGYLMKLRAETLRDLGAALAPLNAFLFLQGLETLSLRMERHVENALAVAAFLDSHELASNVTYAGTAGQPIREPRREVPAARSGCGVLVRLCRRAARAGRT